MPNIEIKYNPAIDFLCSIARINLSEELKKNEIFYGLELNENIEKYVVNVANSLSPMMKYDFDALTKKFTGGIVVPIYICIKYKIYSVKEFLDIFKKMKGTEFFDLYEETFNINFLEEKAPLKLKQKLNKFFPTDDDKLVFEYKKYPEEIKSRLDKLFDDYYHKFYFKIEKETNKFMESKTIEFKEIANNKDISMILVGNVDLDIEENSVLFLSYFYEVGISQFTYDNISNIVFGYLLEQRINASLNKKKNNELLKTLSDENRYEIIKLLGKKKCYSAELAEYFNLSKTTISYHINRMINLGIINSEFGETNRVYLSLNEKTLKEMLDNIYKDLSHI